MQKWMLRVEIYSPAGVQKAYYALIHTIRGYLLYQQREYLSALFILRVFLGP